MGVLLGALTCRVSLVWASRRIWAALLSAASTIERTWSLADEASVPAPRGAA